MSTHNDYPFPEAPNPEDLASPASLAEMAARINSVRWLVQPGDVLADMRVEYTGDSSVYIEAKSDNRRVIIGNDENVTSITVTMPSREHDHTVVDHTYATDGITGTYSLQERETWRGRRPITASAFKRPMTEAMVSNLQKDILAPLVEVATQVAVDRMNTSVDTVANENVKRAPRFPKTARVLGYLSIGKRASEQ